jgi:hypothetical protein
MLSLLYFVAFMVVSGPTSEVSLQPERTSLQYSPEK